MGNRFNDLFTMIRFRHRMGLLFCAAFYLMAANFASAQTGKLVGTVRSSEGTPLPFVSVAVVGTSQGTATNENGKFELPLNNGNHTVAFTHAGFVRTDRQIAITYGERIDLGTIVLEASNEVLNEVVVDGMITKFAKKKSDDVARMPLDNLENPQVYTVVPKELFTEQVSFDLQSVLSTSPGVGNPAVGPGSGGVGMGISMRGFSSINGIGAIRNGMATNFVTLSDPANIESIEIIKGPSSTLFGTTLVTYGGLINRVTKKAHLQKSGEASMTTGSHGLGRLTFDYNTPLDDDKKMLFRLNTAIHREKSFQDFGINRTFMVAPTMTYHVNDRLTLDLDFEYFESQRNATFVRVNASSGITNMDQLDWDFDKSYTTNEFLSESKAFTAYAKATYKLSDQWTSQTLYSYANTENNGNYLFLEVSKPDTISPFLMNLPSTFTTNQVQQNFVGDFKIGSMRNRLVVGLDYTELVNLNRRTSIYYTDFPIAGSFKPNVAKFQIDMATSRWSDALRSERTYSAYVSDVLNVTDRLVVLAALRADRFEDKEKDYDQTVFSPKFGVVYQLVKNKVSLFGNYMDGFKNVAPALTEDNGTQSFDPEHGIQAEGGVKFELLGGKLSSTLSYYNIEVSNRLTPYTIAGNSTTYYRQDGTQNSKGFEVDLIANPIKGTHIILGYGYNENEYTEGQYEGKVPYGTSKHLANFWVSHKLTSGSFNGFGIGIGGNHASDHFLDAANTITVPGYTKFDATVFYDQPKYRIGLKLNNITDEEYWASSFNATPQATRSFLMNFSYRF
ncbi:MAG: TonB-dependent receptor [Breznakibacter sp.]